MKINDSIRQRQPLSGAIPTSPLSPSLEIEPTPQGTTDRLDLNQAARTGSLAASKADLVAKVKEQRRNLEQPDAEAAQLPSPKSPFGADNGVQEIYDIHVDPSAPVPATNSAGAKEYQELLRLNTTPNPYDLEKTRKMADKAQVYQEKLQTQQLQLSVDGGTRSIKVTMPAGIDAQEGLDVVSRLYEASNANHRKSIKQVNLFPGPNPLDEYFELQYRWPTDFVSAMTGGNGTISFYNVGTNPQRQELWDHELAHVFMEKGPETSSEAMVPKDWEAAIASDRADHDHEYVSSYAKTNNKEDFAESYRYYVDAKRDGKLDQFHREYPNRAAILDRLFR